jgi:hypothetical protein
MTACARELGLCVLARVGETNKTHDSSRKASLSFRSERRKKREKSESDDEKSVCYSRFIDIETVCISSQKLYVFPLAGSTVCKFTENVCIFGGNVRIFGGFFFVCIVEHVCNLRGSVSILGGNVRIFGFEKTVYVDP